MIGCRRGGTKKFWIPSIGRLFVRGCVKTLFSHRAHGEHSEKSQ